MGNFINKTLPTRSRERNEESCEQRSRVAVIPVVVEPVVVPVPPVAVPVEVTHVQVVIGVAIYIKRRPSHRPLNTLGAE